MQYEATRVSRTWSNCCRTSQRLDSHSGPLRQWRERIVWPTIQQPEHGVNGRHQLSKGWWVPLLANKAAARAQGKLTPRATLSRFRCYMQQAGYALFCCTYLFSRLRASNLAPRSHPGWRTRDIHGQGVGPVSRCSKQHCPPAFSRLHC